MCIFVCCSVNGNRIGEGRVGDSSTEFPAN